MESWLLGVEARFPNAWVANDTFYSHALNTQMGRHGQDNFYFRQMGLTTADLGTRLMNM